MGRKWAIGAQRALEAGVNCSKDSQAARRKTKTPPRPGPGGVTVKKQRQGSAAWKNLQATKPRRAAAIAPVWPGMVLARR
jgi:hypothetical protein